MQGAAVKAGASPRYCTCTRFAPVAILIISPATWDGVADLGFEGSRATDPGGAWYPPKADAEKWWPLINELGIKTECYRDSVRTEYDGNGGLPLPSQFEALPAGAGAGPVARYRAKNGSWACRS